MNRVQGFIRTPAFALHLAINPLRKTLDVHAYEVGQSGRIKMIVDLLWGWKRNGVLSQRF
jgi:hypothetical protein